MSTDPHPLEKRLFTPGPKRILALDGGGIKGFLTLEFLDKIQTDLRQRMGRPDLVLSDYFDLIGGTSTGSIIAGLLCRGKSVSEIKTIYAGLAEPVFSNRRFLGQIMQAKFPIEALEKALIQHFGEMTLGSAKWKTGFACVAKRLDTGSPWVMYNNPRGKYFNPRGGSGSIGNRDIPIRTIIRASTAAPTYFKPEKIEISPGVFGLFADGGVSPHNNPSLQLFMLATLAGHRFNWEMGADKLLICSVGTGASQSLVKSTWLGGLRYGMGALVSLMEDTTALNETLMQWMSESPTARKIDSELGTLEGDSIGGEPRLTYLRYDAELSAKWIDEELGIRLTRKQAKGLSQMDRPENKDILARVGEASAKLFVDEAHFPKTFDL